MRSKRGRLTPCQTPWNSRKLPNGRIIKVSHNIIWFILHITVHFGMIWYNRSGAIPRYDSPCIYGDIFMLHCIDCTSDSFSLLFHIKRKLTRYLLLQLMHNLPLTKKNSIHIQKKVQYFTHKENIPPLPTDYGGTECGCRVDTLETPWLFVVYFRF